MKYKISKVGEKVSLRVPANNEEYERDKRTSATDKLFAEKRKNIKRRTPKIGAKFA
jgi:hypothetical protein